MKWAGASNPFFAGPNSDWLALLPFVVLAGWLLLVGRGNALGRTSKNPWRDPQSLLDSKFTCLP